MLDIGSPEVRIECFLFSVLRRVSMYVAIWWRKSKAVTGGKRMSEGNNSIVSVSLTPPVEDTLHL